MRIYAVTKNAIKLEAVREAFGDWHAGEPIDALAVDPTGSLPEQPLEAEVVRGAIARAKDAVTRPDADWGVGIEAGLLRIPGCDRWLSVQVCAIADRAGDVFVGVGPGYELPEDLREAVLAGAPLREALRLNRSIDDEARRGAIHFLSDGRLDRRQITLEAVRMALASAAQAQGERPAPAEKPLVIVPRCRTGV